MKSCNVILSLVFVILVTLFFSCIKGFYKGDSQVERLRIAVLDFKGVGVSKNVTSTVSELVSVEMVNSGKFIIIERSRIDLVIKEQGFQQTGCTDRKCAVQVGRLISANKIMIGKVMKLYGTIIITAQMVDIEKGNIECAVKQSAKRERDLSDAVVMLARKMVECAEDMEVSNINKKVDLYGANLSGADFERANLKGANLRGANLQQVNFEGADLTGADLRDSNLEEADLSGANLTNADLRNAVINETEFIGANVKNARIDSRWRLYLKEHRVVNYNTVRWH